jgi:hypothetical protein
VTIVLPPHGMLAAELVDARGERLGSPQPVVLHALAAGGSGGRLERLAEFTLASGPVEIDRCALGQTLAITTADGRRVAGPVGAGERRVLTLTLDDLAPGGFVFTGRALAADGAPLANVPLRTHAGAACTTTVDGRFVFPHPADKGSDLAGRVVIRQYETGRGDASSWERRGARVELPDPLPRGHLDLGDVRFVDAALQVRGRVRGDGPLHGLAVVPAYESEGLRIDVRADGTFEVWALPSRRNATLEVHADEHVSRSVETALPGPELDVALQGAGECTVVATIDPELAEAAASLRAEFVDDAGTRIEQCGEIVDEQWRCSARLPAGSYRCELTASLRESPFAVAPVVTVPPRGAAAPVSFDLRGRVQACRLALSDAAGEPLDVEGDVWRATSLRRVDGESRAVAMRFTSSIRLLGTGEPLDVVIDAGARTGRHVGPFADATVHLSPRPGVAFHVSRLPPAPELTRWVVRAMARAGEAAIRLDYGTEVDARAASWELADVDAAGNGTIALEPRSRYAFELVLRGDHRSPRGTRALPPISGEVAIGAKLPESLTLRFDPEQVRAAAR